MRHKNAQHNSLAGHTLVEQNAINTLVKNGNRVVIPEHFNQDFMKNFDIILDNSNWDIKELAGDLKRNTERKIEVAMEQANNAILFLKDNPNLEEIVRGLGNVKNNKRLNSILFLYKEKMAVINILDIKSWNFDVLKKLL